jgi:competence protein ComEC
LIEVLNRGGPLDEAAGRLRAFTRRAVRDSVGTWSPQAAAIVIAIVIGDRTGLDDRIERRLQEAGTYHVIAISGGNIAILAALTLALFRLAGMFGRVAMLCAAVALSAYGFVVSGGASVSRAVLMAVIYFVARAWDLRGPPFQTLVLAAGILLVADPLSVVDIGALLTFGATAGLVAAGGVVSIERLPSLVAPGVALLVATVAAEAALLPVSAAVFSRVTFAGLVLNFAAIPLMAVAQLAGMACIPLYALSAKLASAVGWLAYIGSEGLVRSADLVALAPWSTWRVGMPAPWVIVGYYGCLLAAVRLGRQRSPPSRFDTPIPSDRRLRRLRMASTAGAFAFGLWIVAAPGLASSRGDGRLHVTFIDVGQGDAALVRLPQGATLLVDAGGLASGTAFDIGDRIVGPVLRHEGVGRLSTVVLTHGDADHIGGAPVVTREFRPWDIWDGVPVPPSEPMRLLRDEALSLGLRWTTVQRTDRVVFGEVEIAVRHPPLPDWERQDVRNDDSIVIELRWRDVSFVFTGDIGREAEAAIADDFRPAPLRVIKVPHHGSITSSSERFVRALAPDVAVISVGRSNNFGHPSPVVLQRYRDVGAEIFRTDQDGAVEIDSDGESLEISTFTGRRLVLKPSPFHHEDTKDTKFTKARTALQTGTR